MTATVCVVVVEDIACFMLPAWGDVYLIYSWTGKYTLEDGCLRCHCRS